ncbi:hypothetical protein MUN76_01335 [Leucobacter rhizosphaerae]|uniref:Integrase n=1 Tax=Leucobacter rhizosphaerae TaxID=2932245 RepID=A0ABY4FWK3_9MICO|nr:hypothetical protein [Leucobacter rhizosphaerae]UOQ60657.1 hypothetical protein MUN76_01335 [Leucobacter rhizosphaerae]
MKTNTVTDGFEEFADPRYVLSRRPLRPGYRLEDTARFDEDNWPLAPASLQQQERGLTLRFGTVPELHRTALKRLCHAMLSSVPLGDEPRPRVSSVTTTFYNLRVFLRWLDLEYPQTRLPEILSRHLEQYQRHLLKSFANPHRRFALRSSVNKLWAYRSALAKEGLAHDPRETPGWSEPDPDRGRENTTDRIPESVHSRVLVWALRFVDEFSGDIIHAIQRWKEIRRPTGSRSAIKKPYAYQQDRIRAYLDAARTNNRPLPGVDGIVHLNAIAHQIGCDRTSLERQRHEISQIAEQTGVSAYAELDIYVQGRLDGKPWIAGVSLSTSHFDSLTSLARMLQIACYIVIAFLSGMRDSELKHLKAGCCTISRDANGRTYRCTVKSTAFKGEIDDHGTTATWVIGEPAARAIRVLEQAHAAISTPTPWLFAPFKVGPGAGSAGRGGNHALTLPATNQQLAHFVTWINEYCKRHDRPDPIPQFNGRTWKLSTRQFRRTLAWYIARRPGGSIAGAIAYRHHSIQMFEGYAGTSDSGFRGEVEAEQSLARGEHMLEMIDRHDHSELIGPAAEIAQERLTAFREHAKFQGVVATDRRQLLRLIGRDDPAIYPDRYVTCVYDPAKALCRNLTGTADEKPNLPACKPLACRNVALDAENCETWKNEINTIEMELKARPSLPPLLASQLRERLEQIRELLHQKGFRA